MVKAQFIRLLRRNYLDQRVKVGYDLKSSMILILHCWLRKVGGS